MSKCPFCLEEIDDDAALCPHCGHDLVPAEAVSSRPEKASNPAPSSDPILYQEAKVTITGTHAVFGCKSYALSNLSYASIKVLSPLKAGWVVLIIIGLVGVSFWLIPSWPRFWHTELCIGVPSMLIAAVGALGLSLAKDTYAVRISGTSGEMIVFTSRDKAGLKPIVSAINQAIAQRPK